MLELIGYPPNSQNSWTNRSNTGGSRSVVGARNNIRGRMDAKREADAYGKPGDGMKGWSATAEGCGSQGEAFTVTDHCKARNRDEGYKKIVGLSKCRYMLFSTYLKKGENKKNSVVSP